MDEPVVLFKPPMIFDSNPNSITAGARPPIRDALFAGLFVAMLTTAGALVFGAVPESLISWDAIRGAVVAFFLVVALCSALALSLIHI